MPTSAELKQSLVQAARAGDTAAADMFKRKLDAGDYDDQRSSWYESAAQGIAQGATLGFHDEAAAALRATLGEQADKYLGGTLYGLGIGTDGGEGGFLERFRQYKEGAEDVRPWSERYQTALESQRGALETARQEDPWTTGLSELAGGLGTAGGAGAAAVAGQGIRKGAARLAGTGAAIGGAAGVGYGEGDPLAAAIAGESPEDVKRELLEAGKSLAIGAGAGGAFGAAAPVLGATARAVTRVVTKPFTKNARINEEGRRLVMDRLQEDIATGDITLDQAKRELAETPGMVVGDLGPALRDLTDQLAQTPTFGGREIRRALTDRNKDQWKRIFPKLSEAIGAKDNFGTARRQLVTKMRDDADRLYSVAYQQPLRMTGRMKAILQTPSGKQALRQGKLLRADLEKNPEALDMAGAMQSTRDIDYIIQSFDDVVNNFYKGGAGKRGEAAKVLRNEFREAVYQQNPDYLAARKAWAGDKANENAMDLGLRLFRDDADMTADVMRGMSDSEKTFFKIGNLRAIGRKLGNKSDTADLTKGIFDRENTREAVKVAFGGQRKFQEFMDFIEQEQKMFNTFKEATGNSKTAKYLAGGQEPGGKLAALFGYTTALSTGAGVPPSIGGYIGRKAYETISPAAGKRARQNLMSNQQANMLMGQNLENIMRPQSLGGLLGQGAQPSVGRATGGLLATDITGQGQ